MPPSSPRPAEATSHSARISKPEHQPLQLLQSGQLLAIADYPGTGLILRKAFHSEFVGPGAAVGGIFDLKCVSVYALGPVKLVVPTNPQERRQAFQRRIAYLESLQAISIEDAPLRRAFSALSYLRESVGTETTEHIPDELIARLVGVFAETVAIARQKPLPDPTATSQPSPARL